MRSRDLILDEDILWALGDLPDQYDFGAYSQFFNGYGTHYVTEGTMGGVLDYVAVVNKNAMQRNGMKIYLQAKQIDSVSKIQYNTGVYLRTLLT